MPKSNRITREQVQRKRRKDAIAAHQMIIRHANMLSEHFSSVQIVATKVNPDGNTSDFAGGSGDIHARVHVAQSWIRRMGEF